MELGQWASLFASRDMQRGKSYYIDGRIKNIMSVGDGWEATAYGSRTYHVFVPKNPSDIEYMTCDCPRFDDGYYCKHLAAACMAIENLSADEEERGPGQQAGESLEALVGSVAESDVRAFLLQALTEDEQLRTQFVGRFGKVDVAVAKRVLSRQIDDAVWECSDGGGFIDWHGALRFERAYHRIVENSLGPLIDRGDYHHALELTFQVFESLQHIEIDDSDGFTTDALENVREYWNRMLEIGDDAFARHLFDRIAAFVSSDPPTHPYAEMFDYERELGEDFLVERFAEVPACYDRMLALCQTRIEGERRVLAQYRDELGQVRAKLETKSASKKSSYRYLGMMGDLERRANGLEFHLRGARGALEKWTLVLLRTLQAHGAGEDELRDAAGELMVAESVCRFFVDRSLEGGDTAEAIRLLSACKRASMDAGEGEYPLAISMRLAELLEGRDTGGYREELLYLIDHSAWTGVPKVRELWARLRESYDSDEWERQREVILDALRDARTRRDCLEEEGLLDRLMDEIEAEGLYAMGSHEAALVEHCPERVLALYLDDIERNRSYPGNSRKGYQQFAARLTHVKGLPGGAEPVARIVAATREAYPRRPALLDELSRV